MWFSLASKKIEIKISGSIIDGQSTEILYPISSGDKIKIVITSLPGKDNERKNLKIELFSGNTNRKIGETSISIDDDKKSDNKNKLIKKQIGDILLVLDNFEILSEMDVLKKFSKILASSQDKLKKISQLKAAFLLSSDGFILEKYVSSDFDIPISDDIDVVASVMVDIINKNQTLFNKQKLLYLLSIFQNFSTIINKLDDDLLLLILISPAIADLREYYKLLKEILLS